MSAKYIITLLLISFSLLSLQGTYVRADTQSLVINEALPDPDGTDAGKEWIEIKNLSTSEVNLKGYRLENINLDSGSVRNISIAQDLVIAPNSFGIISEGVIADNPSPTLILGSGKLNLYNSKAKILLYSASNILIHEFIYTEVKSGKSIESPGFPYCIKNVVNEDGNTVGKENLNQFSICSDTLKGNFEYSNDGENWIPKVDQHSKQLFIRFTPTDPITLSQKVFILNGDSQLIETTLPIYSEAEKNITMNIELTTQFTNLRYDFDLNISIGKPLPTLLFSTDNKVWNEELNEYVKLGTPLYFKESTGIDTKMMYKEKEHRSPFILSDDLNGSIEFKIGEQIITSDKLSLKTIPEILITTIYPSPKSSEKEYLIIKNISNYKTHKNIYLTDNLDNPVQKKISIELEPNAEIKLTEIPSLNNSGDEIYIFFESVLVDHIIYSGWEIGIPLFNTIVSKFPRDFSKPKIQIGYQTISEAKKNRKGSNIRVKGLITYLDKSVAYIQDKTSGIRITGFGDLSLGKSYEILGELSESLGEKKIINIESISDAELITIDIKELDIQHPELLLGQMVSGKANILANYAKSFKISEKVTISLTGFEDFDRTKGDTIRFIGILTKGDKDTFKILPLELTRIDSEVEGVSVSYPIAKIDPEKDLIETIENIRSNGINSLGLALGLITIYFISRFLRTKSDIMMLKFRLWRESRKTQSSLS